MLTIIWILLLNTLRNWTFESLSYEPILNCKLSKDKSTVTYGIRRKFIPPHF
jgi:hypothetical protein